MLSIIGEEFIAKDICWSRNLLQNTLHSPRSTPLFAGFTAPDAMVDITFLFIDTYPYSVERFELKRFNSFSVLIAFIALIVLITLVVMLVLMVLKF